MKPSARASGLLLHPTSLPGGHGIGDLGREAYAFVDFLAAARQQIWQVLPLGPTGYGDSPYQTFSAFAGNPLLIDLAVLADAGWLTAEELAVNPPSNTERVDYGWVVDYKTRMLRAAFAGFSARAGRVERAEFATFKDAQAAWLDDYALFAALKDAHGGKAWPEWEEALVRREPGALAARREALAPSVDYYRFVQWVFYRQWDALKAYANGKGVSIVGDIPIFVAADSADAWANPEVFYFDTARRPTVVAGVPPDYFSTTGQLWGNPLYRWKALAATGYAWWIARVKQALALYDIVRIDHFRGFAAYWEVPAGEETAINGRWVRGPGAGLFDALVSALGDDLPIIAEDLGLITPDVIALRDRFDLPGMKILQFAFDGPANAYLPHNYVPNSVVYTGTHDNDTSRGFFSGVSEAEKAFTLRYLNTDEAGYVDALIRAAFASVSRYALVPAQDVLDLGSEARMNTPSVGAGNWGWRLKPGALDARQAERLAGYAETYGRTPESAETALPHNEGEVVIHEPDEPLPASRA